MASPSTILKWANGRVINAETINYRTYKPEMGGLFCERIFGPTKDWECHCGKYKGIRYRHIVCDRCGVEVNEKWIRRERMGYIELSIPVVHVWYYRYRPNKLACILGLPSKQLEQIVRYERYVVIQPGVKADEGVQYMDLLTEDEYLELLASLPEGNAVLSNDDSSKFIAKMGGEALLMLLQRLDVNVLASEVRYKANNETSKQRQADLLKRLSVLESCRNVDITAMIIRYLPVISPEERPLTLLDSGRFAISDYNESYLKILRRDKRLRNSISVGAPEIILRYEKRLVQEAVDDLFDNFRKTSGVTSGGSQPLKSFSDNLKGKTGLFRKHILGKRVDYSGRSVIVPGPELAFHECGLPKAMALELFKPFVIRRLIDRGIASNIKAARFLIEQKQAVVWDILEHVTKNRIILINRAPTLHRLSILALFVKLVEGEAIRLPILLCVGFNADFDGDQMAVHVPLTEGAIAEAFLLMLSSHNILNPSNGLPITVPSKDILLGLYYLTKGKKGTPESPVRGEGMRFYGLEEALTAIDHGMVDWHAHIQLRARVVDDTGQFVYRLLDTVAGRVVFNQYVPQELGFINEELTDKVLRKVVGKVYQAVSTVHTTEFLDEIKALGLRCAHLGGLTLGLDDIRTPVVKKQMLAQTQQEVDAVWNNYYMGVITNTERYNQIIDLWTNTIAELTGLLMKELKEDQQGFNPIYLMMYSGARGSREQVSQLGIMRGLIGKMQRLLQASVGSIVEYPISQSLKQGLDSLSYFGSAHGTRKGLADSALKTADSGYLTRKLVELLRNVFITEEDCHTWHGVLMTALSDGEEVLETLRECILGRVTLYDLYHPETKVCLAKAGEELTEAIADKVDQAGIEEVTVRTVMECRARRGLCVKCYGRNLATGKLVQIGEPVGTVAAQSIGEPGTQLTLRVFHLGGAASKIAVKANITAPVDGSVHFTQLKSAPITDKQGQKQRIVISKTAEIQVVPDQGNKTPSTYHLPYGAHLLVAQKAHVKKGQELCYWDPYNAVVLSQISGKVVFEDIQMGVTCEEQYNQETGYTERIIIDTKDKQLVPSIIVSSKSSQTITHNLPVKAYLVVKEGDEVHAGQVLAKIPRASGQLRDITGGLPRVTELLEARLSSNSAILSAISGIVKYGNIKRGKRELIIQSKDGTQFKHLLPLAKQILVQDGDYVESGTPLSSGVVSTADILATQGVAAARDHIIQEVQGIYRLQGVQINNKHLELVVRQMMQRMEVVTPGDTNLMPKQLVYQAALKENNQKIVGKRVVTDTGNTSFNLGQIVSQDELEQEKKRLDEQGLKELPVTREVRFAIAKPKIQGITAAATEVDNFLCAASFQHTLKILSAAALRGASYPLDSVKDNIIVGRRIPSGTGNKDYETLMVTSKEEYQALVAEKEQVV